MTRSFPVTPRTVLALLAASVTAFPAAADTLRLDAETVARRAVEVSDLVDAADFRLAGAEADVAAADAARLPVVLASAVVAQRSGVPELSVPISGPGAPPTTLFPSIETTYSGGLGVSQPLYAGGAIAAGREASRHGFDAATADRRRTLADLRFAARAGYWQTVAAAAAVDAALAQEERAARLLEDAQALRAAGMAVDADVLAAEARLASARVAVIRARTSALDAECRLRSLLAVPTGDVLELADGRTRAVPPAPAPLAELTAAAVTRPELEALASRIALLEAQERAVTAARRPSVSLSGGWDVARPNARYLPLEDAWNDSWSVGLYAGWTLFDGDRTASEAASTRAERDTLRAELEELDRRILVEVETARLELDAALEAVPAADAAKVAGEARERASSERYAAGLAQIQELLDAQAELAAAELDQIRTRAAAWLAAAALERAIGR